MKQIFTRTSPSNLKALTAYVLMLTMFLTPLATMAAASPNSRPTSIFGKDSAQNSPETQSPEEKPSVDPPAPIEALAVQPLPEPAPTPVPLTPSGVMTATMTGLITTDTDSDGKADPGDAITYTVTLNNQTSSDATNLSFADTIDSHTTLSGSIKSTPVCFDQAAVSTNEDVAKAITLAGQDPDGDGLTFSIVTPPANGSFGGTA